MPRKAIPLSTEDVSALAKSLRGQLLSRATPPSHVEMLNMLARAAGLRNFQHLRARATDGRGAEPVRPAEAVDEASVARALRHFDERGRLTRWPARTAVQNLCLWALWARVPAGRSFTEPELNALLRALHLFGDQAILRRTLCTLGLMARTPDGREYRRVERPPPPDAAALVRRLGRPRR